MYDYDPLNDVLMQKPNCDDNCTTIPNPQLVNPQGAKWDEKCLPEPYVIHKIVMSRHRYGDGFLFCNGLDASQTSQAPASVRLIVGTSKKCQTFSFSSGLWSDVPDMKVRLRVKFYDEVNVAFCVFHMLLCSSLPPLSCWGCRTQKEFSTCFSMRERVAALLWASLEVCGLCQGTLPQRVVSLMVMCHKGAIISIILDWWHLI